jgi:hypothetical protein
MRRAAALASLVVVVLLAGATARQFAIGREEMQAADRAAAASDWMDAIVHARAAAEALAPGSPWPERALVRLDVIGHDAEARGDETTALLAYGALRSAAIATRFPGSASARWRGRADEGLVRVAEASRDPSTPHASADAMREALGSGNAPPPLGLVALLSAGAAGMIAGLAAALFRPGRSPGRVARAVAVAGFAAYVAALLLR